MAPLMRPSPNASNGYDQQHSVNMGVEHRVTVLEVKVERIEEDIASPPRPQWLEALSVIREILPWCLGLGMLAGAIAGKTEWSSIGEALK